MRSRLSQGRFVVFSTMVLSGAVLGLGTAWGQGGPGEAPAMAPVAEEGKSEAGGGVAEAGGATPVSSGLRKAGEVSEAEDVAFDKIFKELAQIRTALMSRDGKKAKEIADRLVSNNPSKPEAYLVRAELLSQFNALADAKKDIDKALELEPENARANAMSAMLQGRGGDTTAALEKVNKALKTNPNSASLLAVKADILGTRQDVDGIIEALKGPAETLKDPEGAAVVNAKLAQSYGVQKKFPEAMKAIERTIKLRPGDPQVTVIKAQILEASGDTVGAYDTFMTVKNKPGALGANAQFMTQLDAKLKLMEPEAKKIRAQRSAEAQAKAIGQEMEGVRKERAKAVELMEAYQKAPTDTKAREAALAYMLELCEASVAKNSNAELIRVHQSEKAKNPKDNTPLELVAARKKVWDAMSADKSIYDGFYSEKPAESLKKLEELVKIYPDVQSLNMIAQMKFGEKKYKEAKEYAVLAAGMAALEDYQFPHDDSAENEYWGLPSEPRDVNYRYMAVQAKRFEDGALNDTDKVLVEYQQAREKQDWVKVYEIYYLNNAKPGWYGNRNPMGPRVTTGHYKYIPEMEKALTAKGQAFLKAGDKEALKKHLELMEKTALVKQETMEFKLAAQQVIGTETSIMQAVTKTLEIYPFSGPARLVLGQSFEKENKPADAMYHYNTGAKGLPTAGQTGAALDNAKARDRIEATLAKEWMKSYTSFIDAERAIANLEKQRRAMVYAAVTRVLPQHSNKPLLHLIRGQEAYNLAMYDECIQDSKKAIELNKENLYMANVYIGDASYQLSRKVDLTKAEKDKFLKLSAEGYTIALDKAPDKANQANLLYARASRYRDLEEFDKALTDYTKASDVFDDRVRNKAWAYFEASKLKEKKGDLDGARVDAQKAVDVAKFSWTGTGANAAPRDFSMRVTTLNLVKTPAAAGTTVSGPAAATTTQPK